MKASARFARPWFLLQCVREANYVELFCPKKVADKIVGTLPQSIKSLSPLVCRGVEKKVGITERGLRRERGVEIVLDR